MLTTDFSYDLPNDLIAMYPSKTRGQSRLMVIDRKTKTITNDLYSNIPNYLSPKDLLVINNTKVIPARLIGHNILGKTFEVFILEKHKEEINLITKVIIGRYKPKIGENIFFEQNITGNIQSYNDGIYIIKFNKKIDDFIFDQGRVPLPAYIKRMPDEDDRNSYQTIFAKYNGSVVAPTASLNFTSEIRNQLISKGIEIAEITLHVGYGTFKPINSSNIEEHSMHSEYFEIPQDTKNIILKTKGNNKIIALGTTVTRTLESAVLSQYTKLSGDTNIFIYPGFQFQSIDCLITNFHAPKSTVLMMASAFAGSDLLKKAYELAIKEKYRFLSYGDSMLIL